MPAGPEPPDRSGSHHGSRWQTEYDNNSLRTTVPVSDIISTIGTNADMRGRVRRVGLSVRGAADWVHYSKHVEERGANGEGSLRLDFLLNHVAPYVECLVSQFPGTLES